MKTLSNKTTLLLSDMTLFIVAAIWGGGFVAGKYALKGLGPLAILMFRFCGAAIIMGLIFNRRIRLAERGLIKYGLLLGVLQFLGLLIQLFGLQYTTPAKQSFLAATYVIFTPLAAWAITKARPLKKDGLAAFIAILGIALISLNGDLGIQLGDPVTLLFALVFSIQIVLTGRYAKSLDPIALTFYQFSFSGLLSIICVIFSGTKIVCTDRGSLYGVTYLVFINTALAICLQNAAQKYAKDSHTALILSLESVFGFLFSVLIFKETVTMKIILGCILILAALIISRGLLHHPSLRPCLKRASLIANLHQRRDRNCP